MLLGAFKAASGRRLASSTIRRNITSSVPALASPHTVKTVFDVHTVEDLQGISAQEVLRETGGPGRAAASMRHFTGSFFRLIKYYRAYHPNFLCNWQF